MRRVTVLFAVVLVVVAAVPVGAAAAGSQATETRTDTPTETTATGNETTDTNTTTAEETAETSENDSEGIAPGEQLAGVVAVQRAEIDGELESRSFGERVSEAADNESKARVVADQLNESRERIAELRERRSELRAAHEAGNVSRGRYNARAARLTAEIRSLQRLLDRSSDAARELPEETRRSNGIDSEEVERLRTDARNLSGDEVSDIARRVAGPNVGNGLAGDDDGKRGNGRGEGDAETDAPGRSDERGPPSANGSDRGRGVDAAPGRATDGTESDGDSPVDRPGRSGGTLDTDNATDIVPGRATDADGPGNSGVGRERPANGSNSSTDWNGSTNPNGPNGPNGSTNSNGSNDSNDRSGPNDAESRASIYSVFVR